MCGAVLYKLYVGLSNFVGLFARQIVLLCADRGNDFLFVSDEDKYKISIGQPGLPQCWEKRPPRGVHYFLR